MIGRSIGPIRIRSRLGAGGMGTVYLGETDTGRVAVKVLHPHLLEREGAFKRFQREARVGLRIDHPRVVRTLDCDLAIVDGEPRCYLVTEYVEGRTLGRLLEELGRVPEALLREIGAQVADGLDAIHAAGAVHRDLKPENVLITREDEVKIMDLGLAWLPDGGRLSSTGQFLGTPLYAAPEQVRPDARILDGRTDLFALGMVLHELAAGGHPLQGERAATVLDRVLRASFPSLADRAEGISPFFDAVVTKLLERDPGDRFRDAAEVREVLREGERSPWWRRRTGSLRVRPARRLRIRRETALVGRADELERLGAAFREVRRGRGRVVILEGETGVGKTRLVDELVGSVLEDGHEATFLAGGFPPGGAATALGAYADALREHLGLDGLESRLRRLLDTTPLLVPGFAALLRGEPPPANAERPSRESILGAFGRAVSALAAERPVIWLVDDAHFAPAEGLAALAALVPAIRDRAVLLLVTTHPGLPDSWLGELLRLEHVELLALDRLGPDAVERLLREALGSEALGARLGRLVAEESEGNPYFVFEILRGLRENGTLVRGPDGAWRAAGRIDRIELPASLRGLVRARLGDLDPEDRHALEVAACCGVEFDPAPVADALGQGRIPTLRRLAALERSTRLIQAAGRRFAFDHHVVHDELYDGIPASLREAVHAALVDTLATGDEPEGERALAIVRHALLGRRDAEARRHLRTALEHLERSFDYRRAAEMAGRALGREGLLAGAERVDVMLRRAGALHVLGEIEAEDALLEEARAEGDAIGEPELVARVQRAQASLAAGRGRVDEAARGYELAGRVARAAGLVKEEIAALLGLAGCDADRGALDEAGERYERALAMAREARLEREEASATGNLGFLALDRRRFDEARELFENAAETFERIGDRRGLAMARGALGLVLGQLGRYEEALAQHEAHRRVAREIGDRRGESAATGNVGTCLLSLGRLGEAIEFLKKDRAIAAELGNARAEGTAAANLAIAYFECGALEEAREMARMAIESGADMGLEALESSGEQILGAVARELGHREEARGHLDRALALAESSGSAAAEAEALLARSRLDVETDPDAARAMLGLSLERARESRTSNVLLVASALLAIVNVSARECAEQDFEELAPNARPWQVIEAATALFAVTGEVHYRELARARRDELLAAIPVRHRHGAGRLALLAGLNDPGGDS